MSESKNSPTVRIFADIPAEVHKRLATRAAVTGLNKGIVYAEALDYASRLNDFQHWLDARLAADAFRAAHPQEPTP